LGITFKGCIDGVADVLLGAVDQVPTAGVAGIDPQGPSEMGLARPRLPGRRDGGGLAVFAGSGYIRVG
jgi:hypothetical protein